MPFVESCKSGIVPPVFFKALLEYTAYMAHRIPSMALPEGTHQAPERFVRVCGMYLLACSMAPFPM
jgi:hypothetical protein